MDTLVTDRNLDVLIAEQRETNRLLREIAGNLNLLLGKPPIGIAWSGASEVKPEDSALQRFMKRFA